MLFLFGLGTTIVTYAQQESQFTQYMYNTIGINPAYAGSRDVLSINGLYRTQWVGVDGAPKTMTFSLNTPLSNRLGLGFSVVNDKIGPSNESNLAVDFSYNIPVSDQYRLFFGIKGSAQLLNVDFTKLSIENAIDPTYQYNIDNKFSPNVGAGVYLQSNKSYVGISIPYLLQSTHYDHSAISSVQEKMHLYLMGGYVFDLSDTWKFKPATLVKMVVGAPVQLDLSANFLYNEKLTVGMAYRWDAALSAMVGFQVTPGLMAGYAYDFDTSKFGSYNSGSHEIFLRYEFSQGGNTSVVSPRFF
ncbi:type IX secretion system membrane protein PorP/SprF [Flavobacterium sp. 9]|uniref:PorP/SprF family type IX secretion system membrane protein n=1 Tax=Flavobacterium sp. 9 TaxID=2035198 RepID=UPI001E3ED082|nr:type IX secretion system membrane protein PorP/SprF [Flavobacterium sp. 9]